MRAVMSRCPGGKGTMNRIGFRGYCWDKAGAAAAANSNTKRTFFIGSTPGEYRVLVSLPLGFAVFVRNPASLPGPHGCPFGRSQSVRSKAPSTSTRIHRALVHPGEFGLASVRRACRAEHVVSPFPH